MRMVFVLVFVLSFGLLPLYAGRLTGDPTILPFAPGESNCQRAMTTLEVYERYPLLASLGGHVPQELLAVDDYLRLLVPDEGPQLLAKLSLALETFLASNAPQWQKFAVLVQHLYRVLDHVPPQKVGGIPRHIYGEHLIIQLQKLQRPDFREFINEAYRYQSLPHATQLSQGSIVRITYKSLGRPLDQLEKDLVKFSHVLKILLDPSNYVGLVAEAALLISSIFKQSKYYAALHSLPIGDFGQLSPEKIQKFIQSTEYLELFYQLSQQTLEQRPGIFRLWEETLRPALLHPQTHPLVSLFFFKEEPHYFCSIREYHGGLLRRMGKFNKKSPMPVYYYLGLNFPKNYFEEIDAQKYQSQDLPLHLFIPDVGGYLQPQTPNPLIMEQVIRQGQRQHLYLSGVPGSWARQFIFNYFKKDKKAALAVFDVFTREILAFRLLAPAPQNGDQQIDLADLLTATPQEDDLLRLLLGHDPLNSNNFAKALSSKTLLLAVEKPLFMRQQLQLQAIGQKIFEDATPSLEVATFAQMARELNEYSELFHRLVLNIYQEVLHDDNGVIHIADLSPATSRGSWPTKSQIINAYDFATNLEKLRQIEQSYEELLKLRSGLRERRPEAILDDASNYWHFVELLSERKNQVQTLADSLKQVQIIFASIPTNYSGPNSAMNFVKQAEHIQTIKHKLIKTFIGPATVRDYPQ